MKTEILDVNQFIKVNNCPEVTNPIFFTQENYPTDDGLFSIAMFGGYGTYDRKTIFGYIDLKSKFLNPVIYKMLVQLNRKIINIVDGSKTFKVAGNGELIEDENGETGLDFLYKNFRKIKWKETGVESRTKKIGLLSKLSVDVIFIDKYPVIPPFYRDMNPSKSSSGTEINNLYVKLLSMCSTLGGANDFSFMGNITKSKIQNVIMQIYVTETTGQLAKKEGIIRKNLLGKITDYSARAVISSPKIDQEKYTEMPATFTHSGIPLSICCVLFFPFFIYEITRFLTDVFSQVTTIEVVDKKTGKSKGVATLVNPMEDYTPDLIKKLIDGFIKSTENRFKPLYVNTDKGKEQLMIFHNELNRPFTVTDLLFITAKEVVKDKHVWISRYPIENYQNVYPSKINVITTHKTKVQNIREREFKDYPNIDLRYPSEDAGWIESVWLQNVFLKALGGDYDGDMVSLRAVFTQEANKECSDIIFSKKNLLNGSGEPIRLTENEAGLTLFMMTKD